MEEEEGKHGGTEDTERRAPVIPNEKHGRSSTETAGISTGDPLSETARIFLCVFATLRLCTFAFISSLSFELASNLEEGIEDRFADVVEFRLKMIDEFMQSVIHDLFDV